MKSKKRIKYTGEDKRIKKFYDSKKGLKSFSFDEFKNWFIKQEDKCLYCNLTSQETLILCNKYPLSTRKGKWVLRLEMERKNPPPEGSDNNNPGYPLFSFYSDSRKLSLWRTDFEYIHWLKNNEIIYESNNYFSKTGLFYIEYGNSVNNYWPEYPLNQFPGIPDNNRIGEINLIKTDYYCKYLAIYSEEKISKIKNISVKQN
jgi:hypothetical protein